MNTCSNAQFQQISTPNKLKSQELPLLCGEFQQTSRSLTSNRYGLVRERFTRFLCPLAVLNPHLVGLLTLLFANVMVAAGTVIVDTPSGFDFACRGSHRCYNRRLH